jgi:serine/threonine-protein kinase RsbT
MPTLGCCAPDVAELLRLQPMLRGIARRWLPAGEDDDLVQEVLLRALHECCLPRDPGRLRGFLGVVARNICVDWVRRLQRRRLVPIDDLELPAPDRGLEACVARSEVEAALAALDEEARNVVVAFHRDALTHREIAARLGTTAGAVALRLHRARRRIQSSARRRGV